MWFQSPQQTTSRVRLFCANRDSSSDASDYETLPKKFKKSVASTDDLRAELKTISNDMKRSLSEPDVVMDDLDLVRNSYLTSTPACLTTHACPDVVFTPEDHGRKSMSPITRSTQRMCRAMQVSDFISVGFF